MITKEKIDPRDNTFVSFISQYTENPLYIPNEFQREYAWEEEEVEGLLDDIIEVFELGKKYYKYLYTIVVSREGDTDRLVDGQQRLTTLLIIYSCICRMCGTHISDSGLFYSDGDKEGVILSNSEDYSQSNKVLEDIIKGGEVGKIRLPLYAAARTVRDYLHNLNYSGDDLKRLKDMFRKKIIFECKIIPREYESEFFDGINSKGKHLDTTDITKIHLRNVINDDSVFIKLWGDFIQGILNLQKIGFKPKGRISLQEIAFDISLKTMLEPVEPQSNVTFADKSRSGRCSDSMEMVKKFIQTKELASLFLVNTAYILSRMAFFYQDCPENTYLNYKSNGLYSHYPTLILAEKKNIDLSRLCRILDLIYMMITSEGRNVYNAYISPINNMILSGQDIDHIESWFKANISENSIFNVREKIGSFTYRNNNKAIKGILLYIESYLRSKLNSSDFYKEFTRLSEENSSKNLTTIDHISPQIIGGAYNNNIGNLTLLSKTSNSQLGAKTKIKYEVLLSSEFVLSKLLTEGKNIFRNEFTKNIGKYFTRYSEEELTEFSEENIKNRTEELINFISEEICNLK